MKRILTITGLLLLTAIIGATLFLPSQMHIQLAVPIKANYNVVYRSLLTNNILAQELNLNAANIKNKSLPTSNNVRYTVMDGNTNGISITIDNSELSFKSNLKIVPLLQDSMLVIWSTALPHTTNAFKKVVRVFQWQELKKNMLDQLTHLKEHTENVSQVYGLNIERKRMKYDYLLTARTTVDAYPNHTKIYLQIDNLKKYIAQHGGKENGAPMLHISTTGNEEFEMTVAMPVDQKLPDNEVYKAKQMMPGYVLEAKVKGGPEAIKKAFKAIDNYVEDHGLSTPAIPFESMITNRVKEKNTANWLTCIYYPVY